jgi:hypothetical protein
LGLTSRINKEIITAIAVPVKNSWRIQLAFSSIPFSANQFATSKILPVKKTNPTNEITIIFLIPKLMSHPFKKLSFYFSLAHNTDARKEFFVNSEDFLQKCRFSSAFAVYIRVKSAQNG